MNIKNSISYLGKVLHEEIDENVIAETGKNTLDSLREKWKANSSEFIESDLDLLKSYSEIITAIEIFIEMMADFKFISFKEEANEIISELYQLIEKIHDLPVSKRIDKEIRYLIEIKENLPNKSLSDRESQIKKAVATLNSNSPNCKKCNYNMVIREGGGEFFWGCLDFPRCWGKRKLNKNELDILPD